MSKLAILSNGSAAMLSALVKSSGLGAYLDATISVDGTKKVKPTPIATLSSRLGVKSGEVMFVSSNGFDVVGAKHFGLKVAWIRRGSAAARGSGLAGPNVSSSAG